LGARVAALGAEVFALGAGVVALGETTGGTMGLTVGVTTGTAACWEQRVGVRIRTSVGITAGIAQAKAGPTMGANIPASECSDMFDNGETESWRRSSQCIGGNDTRHWCAPRVTSGGILVKLLPVGAARGALGLSADLGAAVLVGATGTGAALGADGGTAGLWTGDTGDAMGAAIGVVICGAATGTDTGVDGAPATGGAIGLVGETTGADVAATELVGGAAGLIGEATGLMGEAATGETGEVAVGLDGAESTIENVMVMAFPDRPVPRLDA
jgi:hypothetical protein